MPTFSWRNIKIKTNQCAYDQLSCLQQTRGEFTDHFA